MVEFEVPLVDQDVDTSDPGGSLMTMVSIVGGFAVLMFLQPIAGQIASFMTDLLSGVTGINAGDSQGIRIG
jgi:hypothetical protein